MATCFNTGLHAVGRNIANGSRAACLDTVLEGDEVQSSGDSTADNSLGRGLAVLIQLGRAPSIVDVQREANGVVRRHKRGAMPDERAASAERISALEYAFRGFAERTNLEVLCPIIGLTFDSLGEAYDYYNLYSWECGFGIRYGKSRLT